MAFCKEYNAQTAKMAGDVVPVEITVYEVGGVASTSQHGRGSHDGGSGAGPWGGGGRC